EDTGIRPSRLSNRRSARHAPAGAVRRARKTHRPHHALSGIAARRADGETGKKAERERGLLLRVHLLLTRYSGGSVYAGVRRQPDVRLDCPRARAVSQQSADPAPRGVQGESGRDALDLYREALMDERAYYNEGPATKAARLQCPFCRTTESYDLRWMVRKKKDRLPPGGDDRDRAKFQKAQSYMVLL